MQGSTYKLLRVVPDQKIFYIIYNYSMENVVGVLTGTALNLGSISFG